MGKKEKGDLRNSLSAILGRWPKTAKQATDWLEARGMSTEEAETAVRELTLAGLLDDDLYARLFVEGHESWGPLRLRDELRRRGVEEKIVLKAVRERTDTDMLAQMIGNWRRAGIDDRRIAGRLIRRGFRPSEIAGALRSSCPGEE
jgi:regulatory protein